jgi:hypothetical protein
MMHSSFTFQMLVNVVFVAVSRQGLVVVASAQLCVKGLALCYGTRDRRVEPSAVEQAVRWPIAVSGRRRLVMGVSVEGEPMSLCSGAFMLLGKGNVLHISERMCLCNV